MALMRILGCLLSLSITAVTFSAEAFPASESLGSGDHTLTLTHAGRERSAIIHVPPLHNGRFPVVFNFHGGGGHAANQQQYSLMDRLADQEGFVVVYPNGTGRWQRKLLTWNAGTCCGYAAVNNIDDVGFVLALLERLSVVLPVDRTRVYATGLSNGAMMAYRLAVEASQHVAAIAPVAGGMVLNEIRSSRAVSTMHFHSVDDTRALYQGGIGRPFPLTKQRVMHPNIEEIIGKWIDHNGCSKTAAVSAQLSDSTSRGHTATRYEYLPCREGTQVIFWKLTGAGHVWPGGKQDFLPRLLGPSTDIVDANTEMWKFFSRFQLPADR